MPSALDDAVQALRRVAGRAGGRTRYAGELLRNTYSVQPSPARSISS